MRSNGMRWRRRDRRAVTPIIATILMIAILIVLMAVLYAFVAVQPPPQAPVADFTTLWGDTSVELLGDGDNAPGAGQCPAATNHICYVSGSQWLLTGTSVPIPINNVEAIFMCNGTGVLQAPLSTVSNTSALAAGGAGDGSPPTSNSLCGGHVIANHCGNPNGSWVTGGGPCNPPDLNCFGSVGIGVNLASLLYYTPNNWKDPMLQAGDVFTAYSGGYCMSSAADNSIGDDYYGPPVWCNDDPGACSLELLYTGTPVTVLGTFEFADGTY